MKITLEATEQVADQLHRIKQRMELSSVAEVFRRALAVYDCVTQLEVENGQPLMIKFANGDERRLELK